MNVADAKYVAFKNPTRKITKNKKRQKRRSKKKQRRDFSSADQMEEEYENLKQNHQQQNEPQSTRKKNGDIIYSYPPIKRDRRAKKNRYAKKIRKTKNQAKEFTLIRSKKHLKNQKLNHQNRHQKRFEQNIFSAKVNRHFDQGFHSNAVYSNVKKESFQHKNSFRNRFANRHDDITKNVLSFKNRSHAHHLNDVRFVSKEKRRLLTVITKKISSKKHSNSNKRQFFLFEKRKANHYNRQKVLSPKKKKYDQYEPSKWKEYDDYENHRSSRRAHSSNKRYNSEKRAPSLKRRNYNRCERKNFRHDYERLKSFLFFSRRRNSYETRNRNSKSRRRNLESYFRRNLKSRSFERERRFETEPSYRNSKFRFTNIMKFDFEMTAVVIFIKRFQQITNVKKNATVLKILPMCFKKSILK